MEGSALLDDQHGCAPAFRCGPLLLPSLPASPRQRFLATLPACLPHLGSIASPPCLPAYQSTVSHPLLSSPLGLPAARRVLKNLAQSWMEDATKRSNM